MSAWISTGVETWISFGSSNLPEPDRLNIILVDDDAPASVRAVSLKQSILRWREDGLRVLAATPWDQPRGDKSDFNDVIREGGQSAVWARIYTAILDAAGVSASQAATPVAGWDLARGPGRSESHRPGILLSSGRETVAGTNPVIS